MSKFQVGDRVAVYGLAGDLTSIRVAATVTDINPDGTLSLNEDDAFKRGYDGYDFTMVHPKQCRKLKKKEKKPEVNFGEIEQALTTIKECSFNQCDSCREIAAKARTELRRAGK
jgi:hypothetical protein